LAWPGLRLYPGAGVQDAIRFLFMPPTDLDLGRLVFGFRPWEDSTLVPTHRAVCEMIGAVYQVALPPQPAQIALALSAGMLNGKRIIADRPGLPPLLVKGSLERAFVTADERFNRAGEKLGAILVQRPRLTLHALRLDTLEFHRLAPGVLPSGAADKSKGCYSCQLGDECDEHASSGCFAG